MGFSHRHITIILTFLLTACTGTGSTPFGGTGGPSALDNLPGGSAAVGDTNLDETAATPDRTGAKIDLDPTGYPKYLFLARMDMVGSAEGLYDPEKCEKLGDCSVYYTTCDVFNQQTVTWGDEEYRCEVSEWENSIYYPQKGTQLDCRHMLPCGPLQVMPENINEGGENSQVYELPEDPEELGQVIPSCGMEYHQVEAIQDGDQCRLPSWPEDLWMDCPSFHEHCEQTSPQILQLGGENEDDQTNPVNYQIDPNQIYLNEPDVDLQPSHVPLNL